MRGLLLFSLLLPTVANAGDMALEVGAHGGMIIPDQLDVLSTSWYATPRVGLWFNPYLGTELDFGISTGKTRDGSYPYFLLAPSLHFAGNPMPEERVQVMVVTGLGVLYRNINDGDAEGAEYQRNHAGGLFDAGVALRVPIIGPLAARADARGMLSFGHKNTLGQASEFLHWQWTVGLELKFDLAKDTDKDKIPDSKDACVTDPEDYDDYEDADGCPEVDNDGDGIEDANDSCPNDAEDKDGFEDEDGCPDPDNDGDTVLDGDDLCPLEAGTVATKGCPDADGDGIADADDRCPEKAGTEEFFGCPDTDGDGLADPDDECPEEAGPEASFGCPDRDSDRVPDFRDECPDKPAPPAINPKLSNGCPARVYVTDAAIVITEKVFFDTAKATIKPVSFGLLDDVAATLQAYPTVKKIEIAGHTDDRGNDDYNMELSQARAQSVMDYLVNKGVDPARLQAKGYGETSPIESNDTAAGREKNRRVEFRILEQERAGHWEGGGPRRTQRDAESPSEEPAAPAEEAAPAPAEEAAPAPAEEAAPAPAEEAAPAEDTTGE